MASKTQNIINRQNLFKDPEQIWELLPYHQWDAIHNKLRLVQAQGLECAPVGKPFVPTKFPVILKPIISMSAERQKYRVCLNAMDYQQLAESGQFAGWFWMPYLESEEQQRCIELIIHNGQPFFAYTLDYLSNPDIPGALSHINLNIPQFDTNIFGGLNYIPGWTNILAPTLKGYTGALSIYYIGSYIISASARWTIWSEYIFQETNLSKVLDKICRLLNTYTPQQGPDAAGVCLELLRQSLGPQVINLVPIYLKTGSNSNNTTKLYEKEQYYKLAKTHWQTISNSLDISINWQQNEPRTDEFMPLIGVITTLSLEQLRKINKYKQISQLAAPEQKIPIVY